MTQELRLTDRRTATASLSADDGALLRDGRPYRLLAGSMHYFRVHPDQWRDRLARLAAMGLNAVDTYVAWNFHERRRGSPDFTGWRDLERFLTLAAEEGLDAVVRPGPYICAEWDNGGLPVWVTGQPQLRPRSADPRFLDAVGEWFDQLIPRIASLQASNGGPVLAVQIENEYGSYGDDSGYVGWIRDALVSRGISELLYTADGPTDLMLTGGTLPDVLPAMTFGTKAGEARRLLEKRRPGEPFVCAEFWNGWFDHWGEHHHVRGADSAAETLQEILDTGGSVSLYMAHGGTNFGLWAGANHDGERLQPTITSYDSNAPVAEDGTLTSKFDTISSALARATGRKPARESPPAPKRLAPRSVPLSRGAGLLDGLAAAGDPVFSPYPLTFEELGLRAGLVLYRAWPVVPPGGATLTVLGLHDRAQVFVDGTQLAVLERGERASVPIENRSGRVRLELLVENLGRINYGPLLGEHKGILGGVQIDRRLVGRWEMTPLPLDDWSPSRLAVAASAGTSNDSGDCRATDDSSAGFATGRFDVPAPADTFISLPGFGKGFLWLNGFLLGRYWSIGPQQTLYAPAPIVRAGANSVVVLELDRRGTRLELRAEPELGPARDFVETFDGA